MHNESGSVIFKDILKGSNTLTMLVLAKKPLQIIYNVKVIQHMTLMYVSCWQTWNKRLHITVYQNTIQDKTN